MKAYSTDLRQKILEIYETTPISQRQLAQRFSVALSFIQKLLKQYRSTGNIAPKPHGGGRRLKLTPEQIQVLAELNQHNNDATLEELRHQLYEKTGVQVSQATIFRTIERLNLTLKKNTLPS
jgi:transposase